MAICGTCGRRFQALGISKVESTFCPECRPRTDEPRPLPAEAFGVVSAEARPRHAIVLTTEASSNLPVEERLGIVSGECVLGVNAFRDIMAIGRDLFRGRSQSLQASMREARETVLAEVSEEAARRGADGVVGIQMTYNEISGGGKAMILVAAIGTAVRFLDQRRP